MKDMLPGLRTIKTCIAVFLCFIIDTVRGSGMPFYAAIAAMLCIKNDMETSIKTAKDREIGTIIGCIAGSTFLFVEQSFLSLDDTLLRYLILTILLIPVIHFSVKIDQKDATYLACVVFLSVTIDHADETPLSFATVRFIDTNIGMIVGLLVDWLPSKFSKVKDDHGFQ